EVEFVSNSYIAGRIRVIQCSIRDITDRKRAEEDLKKANHELQGALGELQNKSHELASMTQQLWQASKLATMGELAASIAHELNNPLTTVTLSLEALMMQLAGDEQKIAILDTVSKESERMASLVGNLLQFSRRSHAQVSTLNLDEELSSALTLIDYHLRSHNVKVVQDIASNLPAVQADRQQLLQVFLNLLTNASDAMPEGGSLKVRIRPDQLGERPAVLLEFADTGTGIEATNLQMIWEPFFTTKPTGKGTGLGLPICRRTIEEHGGTITIESEVGVGTCLRIKLPATAGGNQPDNCGGNQAEQFVGLSSAEAGLIFPGSDQ
ncbi:MAG TPA: ATP-binding protein, partial [Pyrinomonadaceae bacterium]|nr:ATP-binding protein [Pyrinomonadaceae bacterium]